jgi:ABC-type sugar transport system substrate-binding protein
MRRRSNRLIGLAACLALALSVAACGDDDDASSGGGGGGGEKGSIMAFVQAPRGTNDVTRAWFNGLEAGGDQVSDRYTLEVKAPGKFETDAGAYLNFIRSALVKQPDGIVVIPNNAAGMKSGLEQIAEDTKVLIMDQDVKDMTGKVAFVGTDNLKAGTTAAEWMVQQFDDKKLASNEVAVLGSTPGISSTDDRLTGFEQGLEGSDLKIVSKLQPACDDPTKSRAAMADVLTAHPNLGGVFSVCDSIALGASRVILDKGDKVKQIAVDASEQGVQAMVDHKGIDAEIAQHFFDAGEQSVVTLAKALDGDSVPPTVDTGVLLVTEDNAEDYLAQAAKEAQ